MSYGIWRALPHLCQLLGGQVVTDEFSAPLTGFSLFFMASVLDPFSAGPAHRAGWFSPKAQPFKRQSYLVRGKSDGSVGLLSRTCPLSVAFGRYQTLIPKLQALNPFFPPGKVSRNGCARVIRGGKRGPCSRCCSARGRAKKGQTRPRPSSTAEAEAGRGAGMCEQPGNMEVQGWMGSGRQRRPYKAVGEGAGKGAHCYRELLVVSTAEGQAGWQFLCHQELPAGKAHTTQHREKRAPCPSLARTDRKV